MDSIFLVLFSVSEQFRLAAWTGAAIEVEQCWAGRCREEGNPSHEEHRKLGNKAGAVSH